MVPPSAEVIEENDLFAGIPLSALADFLEAGEEREYPERTIILEESSDTDGLYYIVEGSVSVVKGNDTYVDVLGKGECFGEMTLFSSESASASIVSQGTVTLYFFPRSVVGNFVQERPEFAVPFFKSVLDRMSSRLRKTTNALSKIRSKTESLLNKEFEEIFSNVDLDFI